MMKLSYVSICLKIVFFSCSKRFEAVFVFSLTGECLVSLQELAGFTGGDASFFKEDFELQLNRRLFWDSVRVFPTFFLSLNSHSVLRCFCSGQADSRGQQSLTDQ